MVANYGKQFLKTIFLRLLEKIIENEEVQSIIYKHLKRPIDVQRHCLLNTAEPPQCPELIANHKASADRSSDRDDIILITARFRSGSTLLWNLFRHIEGMTSYYEPFNERRWFDKSARGDRIDTTHKHVDDYWREYDNLEILNHYYRTEWIDKNLLMDGSFWAPEMKRFVELMVEKAPGRPVLQFNRIDFRLPWFRHHFPHAKIVHLYRNPRDQWCSSLKKLDLFSKTAHMQDFEPHDHFYLRRWARDLQYHFPFLGEDSLSHPYQMFYYIWKLSYLVGMKYSHISLSYEKFLEDPETLLHDLFSKLNIKQFNIDALKNIIVAPKRSQWKFYADEEWFSSHEVLCESVLTDFLKRS